MLTNIQLDKHTAAKYPDVIDSSGSVYDLKEDLTVDEKHKSIARSDAVANVSGLSAHT